MPLTLSDYLLWMLGTALKVLLCVLVFYRRLYHRLPIFAFYTALLLMQVAVLWWVYHKWGIESRQGWNTYWWSMWLVITVRTLFVAEICWKSLKSYPAIWSLVRDLLVLVALAAFTFGVIRAFIIHGYFVVPAEQGFEIAILTIVFVLILLGIKYQVPLEMIERNIIVGLGIYLMLQVISDSAMNHWGMKYIQWWRLTRQLSFDVALVLWIIPLLRPLPPLLAPPQLLSERESRHFMLRTLVTMRRTNRKMEQVEKSLSDERKNYKQRDGD